MNPFFSNVAATPVGFARSILGLTLYAWQEQVLWDVALGEKTVALAAANGSGKTSMIAAPLLLWHCAVFPGSEVVTTAGVFRQVKEQLWRTLHRFQVRLGPEWKINDTTLLAPNGSRAIGFSTDDPYKFEGWHGGANGYLLLIFDEAKAIPDSIFEAARRCNAKGRKRFLLMSSTGGTAGEFAAALTRKRHLYSLHHITAYDCPHLKIEESEQIIAEYGREHPLVRSMIFSELVDESERDYVISARALRECRANPPEAKKGARWAFIDWAAGGDECVIAILEGNQILPLLCWRDTDTAKSVGRAAHYLQENDVPLGQLFADGDGLGIPMNRQLIELGAPVMSIHNGARAHSDHYANYGAELWHRFASFVQKKEIILPIDPLLDTQLTSRKIVITPQGKLGIETKAQMRARGLPSPDRADAVVGVAALVMKRIDRFASFIVDEEFQPSENSLTSGFDTGD